MWQAPISGRASPACPYGELRLVTAGRKAAGRRRAPDPAAVPQGVHPGPVEVDAGPNQGAKASYLRIHDGIRLELFQPPGR